MQPAEAFELLESFEREGGPGDILTLTRTLTPTVTVGLTLTLTLTLTRT